MVGVWSRMLRCEGRESAGTGKGHVLYLAGGLELGGVQGSCSLCTTGLPTSLRPLDICTVSGLHRTQGTVAGVRVGGSPRAPCCWRTLESLEPSCVAGAYGWHTSRRLRSWRNGREEGHGVNIPGSRRGRWPHAEWP